MRLILALTALTLPMTAALACADEPSPGMGCGAAKLRSFIGKPATPAAIKRATTLSGAKVVRVIKPGQAVTMDYHEGRLNLELDAKGRFKRATCG